MPNGGSDCCGTCNFNRKNRGVAGYGGRDNPEPHHCDIRDLAIENAFWTYCANHPHHNPDGVRIPIGPVYRDSGGHPYGRQVWVPAPDTPEIRAEMIRFVSAATADSARSYHGGLSMTEAAIRQLGEWRVSAAVPHLDRVRGCVYPPPEPDDQTDDGEDGEPQPPRVPRLTAIATTALRSILPPESLTPFVTETVRSLAAGIRAGGHFDRLPILADALEEAGFATPEVLAYLRSNPPGPNWVVDAVTGQVP